MILTILIIPFLIWGGVALMVAIIGGAIMKNGDKLAVLGMQGAGKTRFLCFLRGVPYVEQQTAYEKYPEFSYKIDDKITIKIKSGYDIGGGKTYIREYDNLIKESKVILFMFNISRYLAYDQRYVRDTNSRLDLIKGYVDTEEKNIVIIGTHKDLLNIDDNEIKRKFDELMNGKPYSDMVKNIFLVDLTDKADICTVTKEIFKK